MNPTRAADRIRVLHDCTNPVAKSQPELTRAAMNDAHYVDQALREVSRRLLGKRAGAEALEEPLDPSDAAQAKAWALTTAFLSQRLQASANDCTGRAPDMSVEAAAAFRAVLSDVAAQAVRALTDEFAPRWARLIEISQGEAAALEPAGCAEAAAKLLASAPSPLRAATPPLALTRGLGSAPRA